MSDKLREALEQIQGTCQEVAHEVEDPTQAVAEIEALTRKALRAKSEPVVPLSEVREALLDLAVEVRAEADREGVRLRGLKGEARTVPEERKSVYTEAANRIDALAAVLDTPAPSEGGSK